MNQYFRRVLLAGATCLTVLCGTFAVAQTSPSDGNPSSAARREPRFLCKAQLKMTRAGLSRAPR